MGKKTNKQQQKENAGYQGNKDSNCKYQWKEKKINPKQHFNNFKCIQQRLI